MLFHFSKSWPHNNFFNAIFLIQFFIFTIIFFNSVGKHQHNLFTDKKKVDLNLEMIAALVHDTLNRFTKGRGRLFEHLE